MRPVAELLADLLDPGWTPANPANPAKNRASIDAAADSDPCEGLRISANPPSEPPPPPPDSQTFAGIRRPANRPESKHSCGSSQDSQLSQGYLPALQTEPTGPRPYKLTPAEADAAHAEPWSDDQIAAFVARVSLFMRRGQSAADAVDLAERLHLRDVRADDRRLCIECAHLAGRPGAWRCGNHRPAGVGAALPRALVTLPQRCRGFSGG